METQIASSSNLNLVQSTAPNCGVCIESFNKSNHYKIVCNCGYECCRSCVKTYLLSSIEGVNCMSCKRPWTRKFMAENFEKSFMSKVYKEYRENLLFEKELALLPMTQPHVERAITEEKLKNEAVDIINQIYDGRGITIKNLNLNTVVLTYYTQNNDFQIKHWNKQGRLIQIQEELSKLKNADPSVDKEKNKFVRQCPNNECRGFLSTSWKCNLCGIWACPDCHEIKGDQRDSEHTCKPEILESVKMMEKDTKPCPKCATLIFKTEGCDQMFCLECHTAFSWKTLKIETGTIHNPHYFEYLAKKNGSIERNPMDVICGREIDAIFVHDLMREMNGKVAYSYNQKISNICMNIIHIRSVEIPHFTRNHIQDNMDIRIQYMMNKITKEKFKMLLQRREKNNEKNTEICNILATFVNCMTEIIYRYYMSLKFQQTYYDTVTNRIYNEIVNLVNYINECFDDVAETYKCKNHSLNLSNNVYYMFT